MLHLYALCDRSIGRLGDMLREAAIGNARERITVGLLDSLGLSPPPSFRSFLFCWSGAFLRDSEDARDPIEA